MPTMRQKSANRTNAPHWLPMVRMAKRTNKRKNKGHCPTPDNDGNIGDTEKMELKEVDKSVKAFFKEALGKTGNTIGIEQKEDGWKVLFEAVEDPGAGFDPILGLYEVIVDKKHGVTRYERKSLRRRSELEWHALQEIPSA